MPEYAAWGLRFLSDVPLPGLPAGGPSADGPPVTVRFGTVPPGGAGVRIAGPTIRAQDWEIRLDVVGLATCRIQDGQDITIQPEAERDAVDVTAALLRPLVALVLHSRGFLPLHASAVEVNGGAVAFVGRACVGKSAIAAVLRSRGRRLVTDDLLAVDTRAGNRPMLWPGPPSLHLWPDVIQGLGLELEATRPLRNSIDKRVLDVPGAEQPLPVRHVTVIDAYGSGADVDRRSGLDALSVLVASSWHANALDALQMRAAHFARCALVANNAAIWRWPRPDGVQRMAGSLAGLEAAWRVAERT